MELNLAVDETLEDINQEIVKRNPPSSRSYLQCNNLGADCERQSWYRWRDVMTEHFNAGTLCTFGSGFDDEALMTKRLRMLTYIDLDTRDSKGKEYEVSDFAGHVLGHLDGVITGVKAAPKTMHVWEHKSVNPTKFKKLKKLKDEHGQKAALELWDSVYYAQATLYMGLTGLKRHYLTVTTPGGRDMTTCRTNYDAGAFKALQDKALRILESEEAPPKISKRADYYICKWCNFSDLCHGNAMAKVHCRTCAHSTPLLEEQAGAPGKAAKRGAWKCEYHSELISTKKQREGCPDHLYNPSLINWATTASMDAINNRIVYVTNNTHKPFVNASRNDWSSDPMCFTSKDLQHLNEELLDSEHTVLQKMASFQTAHVETVKKAKDKPKDGGVPFDDPIPF